MQRLPIVSSRQIIRALLKHGFDYAPKRGKGSHAALMKRGGGRTRLVIVPDRKDIPRGTLLAILEQAGLSKDEFVALLSNSVGQMRWRLGVCELGKRVLTALGCMKRVDVRCEEVCVIRAKGDGENAIIALYNRVSSENERHRDYEWKITAWIVAIFFGIIYLVKEFPILPRPSWSSCILYVIVVVGIVWGILMIWQAHENGAKSRQVMRKCEMELGVDGLLLHDDWKKPPQEITPCNELRYVIAFSVLIIVMGIATGYYILEYCPKETPCQQPKK